MCLMWFKQLGADYYLRYTAYGGKSDIRVLCRYRWHDKAGFFDTKGKPSMSILQQFLNVFFHDRLFTMISIENIQSHHQCDGSPEGDGQFVGVEEIVHSAVNVIGNQGANGR